MIAAIHSNAAQAAALGVAVALGTLVLFVVNWMLIGWGVSIAVRTYRWCMRYHEIVPAERSESRGGRDFLAAGR